MNKKVDLTITVNGRPLSEFLDEQATAEIEKVRVDIVGSIKKTVYKKRVAKGRGPGNPGVHKPRVYSPEEIARINAAKKGS